MTIVEALVAVALLSGAGVGTLMAIRDAVRLADGALDREVVMQRAESLLHATLVMNRDMLERRLGARRQGPFVVVVQRPTSDLYCMTITEDDGDHPLLATCVMKPAPSAVPLDSRSGRRAGFSLVELLVALVLSSMAILGLTFAVSAAASTVERSLRGWEEESAALHGVIALRRIGESVRVAGTADAPFTGTATAMEFGARCRNGAALTERCVARVLLSDCNDQRDVRLTVTTPFERHEMDLEALCTAHFLYLVPESGDNWVASWGPGRRVPDAVAVVDVRDTLVVRLQGAAQ